MSYSWDKTDKNMPMEMKTYCGEVKVNQKTRQKFSITANHNYVEVS